MKPTHILLFLSVAMNMVQFFGNTADEFVPRGVPLASGSSHGQTKSRAASLALFLPETAPQPMKTVSDEEMFPELTANENSRIRAMLQPYDNLIVATRAAATGFHSPADEQQIGALKRQRMVTMRDALGEDRYFKHLLNHTELGKKLQQLTGSLHLTESELRQIIEDTSDGVELNEIAVLNWVEEKKGAEVAVEADLASDARLPQIAAFQSRYGVRAFDDKTMLNFIRTLQAYDASTGERILALQHLHLAVPEDLWLIFSSAFQIQEE